MKRRGFLHALAAIALLEAQRNAAAAPRAGAKATRPPALITGIDHIPIAVRDLDAAAAQYRQLGFTLKPGMEHANGLRNEHAKFADGTELELITAPAATDALTTEYRRRIAAGDAPAFIVLHAPDQQAVMVALREMGQEHESDGRLITFHEGDPLRYVFFGPRNASPTDMPAHFVHRNGAESVSRVWLAADDFSAERNLLARLGASFATAEVQVPRRAKAEVARFADGEILMLPASAQWIPDRRVVGATLRTAGLAKIQAIVAAEKTLADTSVRYRGGPSLFITPEKACGIWLEFRAIG